MSEKAKERNEEPKRQIGLLDLVFTSLGGQSPFLSILTYGITAFLLARTFASIAIILGTLLVLVNGLSIYILSKKFTQSGGYFTYSYFSISRRLGFETGWIYLVYSTLYGSAYVLGASFILASILHINSWITALVILAISSLFALLGIRPSAKYAMFASIIEISIMTILAFLFLQSTHFTFYNPFSIHIPIGEIILAILFGSSIPTGYGSITPLAGEVKDPKKNVPRAIIIVILLGGLLAAFDIYAISDHVLFFHLPDQQLNLISLIESRFGLLTLAFVLFAAANDGILASLTFILASSRTAYSMAYRGFFPKSLAILDQKRGPVNATTITIIVYFAIVIASLFLSSGHVFSAFEFIGGGSLLANLFVHITSNSSLLRVSAKRYRRRISQITIGSIALIFSLYILFESAASSSPVLVYLFMSSIISGFLVAEVIDIAKEQQEKEED
ncbi:amino acid permease [Candidatus Acidianus copahuensis]|uniref:Amino acid permease n=1 Tax=Candidatus Acidianus copahuensis TaxID=1160895 RepID=A0A031LTI9_9CREN|nr:APC family permease [Candidatus Acidianus copahuensis]EZQ11096.1 amino acid permease [Candidatus Acidianus copahuensis]